MADKDSIIKFYIAGYSIVDISELLGISRSTAHLYVNRAGIARTRAEGVRLAATKGKLSKNKGIKRQFTEKWKENIRQAKLKHAREKARGTTVSSNGYVRFTTGMHSGKLVHVIIMESRLGRRLLSDESVHHIDGNKQNNDEDNLALMTKGGHSRHHKLHTKGLP